MGIFKSALIFLKYICDICVPKKQMRYKDQMIQLLLFISMLYALCPMLYALCL